MRRGEKKAGQHDTRPSENWFGVPKHCVPSDTPSPFYLSSFMRLYTNGVCISGFTGFMSDQTLGLCSRMASFLYFSREKIKKLSFNRVVTSGPWCQHVYLSEPCSLVKTPHTFCFLWYFPSLDVSMCIGSVCMCAHTPHTRCCKMLGLSKCTESPIQLLCK